MEREFDVIILGAGPAGEVMGGRLVDRGARQVALVERELVGGECSFWACMPSKALLRPSEVLGEVRRVPGAAEAVSGELDTASVLARRDEVIRGLDDASQMPWLDDRGIKLFRDTATLDGERRVRVGEDVLVAREAVVLAVGSGAAMPPIPGLAEASAWSNREVTTAQQVPERLLVLGGGVGGVETALAGGSLGSRVTVIEADEPLTPREEPGAADEVRESLEAQGVDVRTGVKASEVRRQGEVVTVHLSNGEAVSGDQLLVAVGRKPHTDGLGLDTIGLPDGGYVEVDEHMRVPGYGWLYAVGDVNGRSLLTHSGKYQGRVATDTILGEDAVAWADAPGAPRVIFTDPQVAAIGLTLAAAREQGLPVEAIDLVTSGSAGASFVGRGTKGTSRFVIDTERQVLVGVTFVGFEVMDFLHAATIAVVGEVPLRRLAHAVAPFPTRSELWLKLIEAYEERHGLSLHVR